MMTTESNLNYHAIHEIFLKLLMGVTITMTTLLVHPENERLLKVTLMLKKLK